MSNPEVETLMRRLDRLERGLRRWRILGGVAWTALAASIALMYVLAFHPLEPNSETDEAPGPEAAVDDEVRAHAFVLVDDEGQPRAALAMRPDGTPALAFTGPDGNITWKALGDDKGPSATAPSTARSTYGEYASRAAIGRRLAAGPLLSAQWVRAPGMYGRGRRGGPPPPIGTPRRARRSRRARAARRRAARGRRRRPP